MKGELNKLKYLQNQLLYHGLNLTTRKEFSWSLKHPATFNKLFTFFKIHDIYQHNTVSLGIHPFESLLGTRQLTLAFRFAMSKLTTSIHVTRTFSGAYSPSKLSSSMDIIQAARFPAIEAHQIPSVLGLNKSKEIALRLNARCGHRHATA